MQIARIFRLLCVIRFFCYLYDISCFNLHIFAFIQCDKLSYPFKSMQTIAYQCLLLRNASEAAPGQEKNERRWADAAESGEEQTLFTQGGEKNAHLPTRVYNDHGCDYVQLPGDRLCRDR